MLMLVAAMTGGTLVLLALEGKPLQPMPFSLSSQGRLTDFKTALVTDIPIEAGRWRRIDVSYRTNQGRLSPQYGLTGELAQKYHIVIPDRVDMDCPFYTSSRWTKQLACLDPPNGLCDSRTIKICLITRNLRQPVSTPSQVRQLQELVNYLVKNHHIEPQLVWMPDRP
ncbi:MAG: hypothetical protein AMJ79_15735 [Phycisphaerae bacterium SM23_30]|nr:MAG: hypothetical protein AMJ79_15735 [Phycisphaerae bacterium SM23_30]